MKKKRTFIGIAIFVAVLMLGIGYAAISAIPLSIAGTANAAPSDANFKVKFDETVTPTISKSNENIEVLASITDETHASITVNNLSTNGDNAQATYTIKNESPELSAELALGTITNSNTDYFEVTADFADTTVTATTKTTTITVTVKLIKTPAENQSANITIPFTASAIAN